MRNCPICLSTSIELKEIIPISAYLDYPINGPYILSKCNDCSFYYHNTNITQEEIDQYYIGLSKYENAQTVSIGSGGLTDLDKKRLNKTFENITSIGIDLSAKILDIGCAAGGLLEIFKSNGYENIYGSDPSAFCASFVRSSLGCTVYAGSFLSVEIKEKFDLIILTHVLEHILDIREFIKKIKSLLKKDGVVYIECPDSTNYHTVIHAPYQELNTEHINHFSTSDFENIASQLNLQYMKSGLIQFSMENGLDYYANWAIMKNHTNQIFMPLVKSVERDYSMNQYLEQSDIMLKRFHLFLSNYKSRRILLLGIGQLSFKLIPILHQLNFEVEIFDNDQRNWGKKIGDLTVKKGEYIVDRYDENFAILISSMISFNAIKEGLNNLFTVHGKSLPQIISLKKIFTTDYE